MENRRKKNPTSLSELGEIYTPENMAIMSAISNLSSIFQLDHLVSLTFEDESQSIYHDQLRSQVKE